MVEPGQTDCLHIDNLNSLTMEQVRKYIKKVKYRDWQIASFERLVSTRMRWYRQGNQGQYACRYNDVN